MSCYCGQTITGNLFMKQILESKRDTVRYLIHTYWYLNTVSLTNIENCS